MPRTPCGCPGNTSGQAGTRLGQVAFRWSRRAGLVRLSVLGQFQGPRSELDGVADRMPRMFLAGSVRPACS